MCDLPLCVFVDAVCKLPHSIIKALQKLSKIIVYYSTKDLILSVSLLSKLKRAANKIEKKKTLK